MKKALVISRSVQSAESLSQLLRTEDFSLISIVDNSKTAKKLVEKDEFELICINAPLAEESGLELSKHFAEKTRSSVVIIVPQKNADDVNDALTECGVLVIAKPINKHLFHHYLQFTECFRKRMLSVNEENEKLRHIVEDMKIINRAKLLLITCLNMTESEAHRYLEKQAMDLRMSKMQIAMQVIKTYEN